MPRTSDRADDAEILRLVPLVWRVLANRIRDPASVDDLVQETLVRVLEARQQLEQDALTAVDTTQPWTLVRIGVSRWCIMRRAGRR